MKQYQEKYHTVPTESIDYYKLTSNQLRQCFLLRQLMMKLTNILLSED